jgi:hypothetical protein
MSQDGIDSVIGKRGLLMCRIASLLLLQKLKGSMSGDAHDFNPPPHGKTPNEIHAILTETLGEHAPSKLGGPV